MSLLHRNEPPRVGVNDALAVEGHWLGRHFRVNVPQNPYHSGAAGGDGAPSVRLRQGKSIVNEPSVRSSTLIRLDNLLRCAYTRAHGGRCQASQAAFRPRSLEAAPCFLKEMARNEEGTRRSPPFAPHSPEGTRR